jgi:hypothetical protein
MPQADLVVIDPQPDGIFLLRHTLTGAFGGDTWHQSIDEARDQALREYGGEIEWLPIPDGEPDAVAYVLRAAEATRAPTYVQFTNLMASDRSDDKAWMFFWSDVHDGLAGRAFPGFWKEARSRRPSGTVREVIDAWPTEELKQLWRDHIYKRR